MPNARKPRLCARCGVEFLANPSPMGWQKFCSSDCRYSAAREATEASLPPQGEVERLYHVEGMTDKEIGRHYGKSYQWVLTVRRRYGIQARPPSERSRRPRDPKSAPSRLQWHLTLKGETTCRSCGGQAVHLHHIVPRSKTRLGRVAVETNGMPLCFDCHRGWHDGRLIIFRDRLRPQELQWAIEHAGPVWVEAKYPYRPDHALRRAAALSRGEDPEEVEVGGTERESLEIAAMFNERDV